MSTAVVDPNVVTLAALLEQLGTGQLRVPRFQRPFVWTGDRVVNLLRSVKKRYPIGSLLIWRARPGHACFDHVGPHPVPVPDDEPGEVGYLLDGHQRLSSLFGTLVKPAERLQGKERRPFAVYFDLDKDDFVRGDPKEPWHVPLWVLMEPVLVLDRAQELQPQGPEASAEGARDRWVRRTNSLKQLSSVFQTYRIAINEVKNADLDTAVNVFTLLNSTGVKVSPAEMFGALSWKGRDAFDFAGTTARIRERVRAFANVDATTVLRAFLARLDEDIYTTDFSAVVRRHGARLAEEAAKVEETFTQALVFARQRWGVASIKALPYALQLVLLSEYFRLAGPSDRSREDELLRALWLTSYTGAYTVGSAKGFNDAVEQVRRFAAGEAHDLDALCDGQVRAFPKRFHPKAARVRVFFLFLKALRPRDPTSGEVLDGDLLLERGLADTVQVVTSAPEAMRRLSNRLLLGRYRGEVRAQLITLFESGRPDRQAILDSHAISEEALLHLVEGDDDGFLDARERHLIAVEKRFIEERLRSQGPTEATDEAEIDTGDDEDEDF